MKFIAMVFDKVVRLGLMRIYGFDKWHTSPSRGRDYIKVVVEQLNQNSYRGAILEIGCGLGDILRQSDYSAKHFRDLCPKVLKAAKLLSKLSLRNGSKDSYASLDFTRDTFEFDENHLDALVLVNWIHNVESKILKKKVAEISNLYLKTGGIIIFDVINGNSKYQFNHQIEDLIVPGDFKLTSVKDLRFGREIVVAEKI
ncbi:MAG: class I SAM-dependent methyltransferase [Colwellia sp.]